VAAAAVPAAAAPVKGGATDEPDEEEGPKELEADAFLRATGAFTGGDKVVLDELHSLAAPKGAKLGKVDESDESRPWRSLTAGDLQMSVRVHSPEQDTGAGCPSMADVRASLGGAKVVRDEKFAAEPKEIKKGEATTYLSLGDKVEVLEWESGGKAGFYAIKNFDQGDDSTNICCVAGAPATADKRSTLVDPAQAKVMASICLSAAFDY
jgi:hypothetical protein